MRQPLSLLLYFSSFFFISSSLFYKAKSANTRRATEMIEGINPEAAPVQVAEGPTPPTTTGGSPENVEAVQVIFCPAQA